MALDLPSSLSPSRVASYTSCALQFRYSSIDKIPERPSVAAVRGTLVHAALEELFTHDAPDRTRQLADSCLEVAWDHIQAGDEFNELGLDDAAAASMRSDASTMLDRYFTMEDPTAIHPIGIEIKLEIELGGLRIRGIIDRLELTESGGLIVTDYKTGRAPSPMQESSRLSGVHIYSLMCEKLFGRRPEAVQLLYLGSSPQFIVTRPNDGSTRGLEQKLGAIWTAIERACENDDFRPRPSPLCNWCSFRELCPAMTPEPAELDDVDISLGNVSGATDAMSAPEVTTV